MKKYDCIIIGGGLSGLTLGIQLLKQNKKVLIVEKQDIRKYKKLCGGLLTKKSYDLLSSLINIEDLNITKHNKSLFHNENQHFYLDVEIYT
ncbi:MAG: NAD(P)-binding protein, partial [Bacilli bacterium]|nr:NAD(P)-binding protein [Bacilli bacterium]